jgi:hypothetical protein
MFFIPLFTALFVLGTYWQQTAFLVALAAPAQRDGVAGDLESIDIPVGPTQGIVSDSGFLRGPPSSPHLLARQTCKKGSFSMTKKTNYREDTQCCSAYLCCYADQVCYLDFQSVPQCCPSSWVKCGDNGCFCCPNGSSCGKEVLHPFFHKLILPVV